VSLGNGVLAINMEEPHKRILIPASGRFNYETLSPTDVVSDDDDDDMFPGPSGLSKHPRQNNQANSITSSPNEATSNTVILLPSSNSQLSMEQQTHTSASAMELEPPAIRKRKRYGSGLGNLGNTCFMNSTLQCLAHTEPLRRYFLSGDYENDLNRDNPLGTGGELATQFAELLDEMWLTNGTTTSAGVVYPRSFKHTLGKHAEQFLGYDQHDSQELATYLLDALHEDTNRVTKKPYIEKPEQGESEPDDIAADKAWDLHLQREDSRVLEHFMGQVKSHVQCPKQGCGRVSTTFDPFMYLSVPIPGATDRTLKITFIPLERSNYEMKITMHKTGTVMTLQKKVCEEWREFCGETLELQDLVVADVWNGEVYSIYKDHDEIEKIRETDVTFLYQMIPSAKLAKESDEAQNNSRNTASTIEGPILRNRPNRIKLPVQDLTEINIGEEWRREIDRYVQQMTLMSTLLNPKRATTEGLLRFYEKLGTFIDKCYDALAAAEEECEGQSKNSDDDDETKIPFSLTSLETLQERALNQVCVNDPLFTDVTQVKEIARLEFCERKFYKYIIEHINDDKNKYREGLNLQIIFQRKESSGIGSMHQRVIEKSFTTPLCLRVPGHMTVYELRELLAARLPFKNETLRKGLVSSREKENNARNHVCNEVFPVVEKNLRKGDKSVTSNLLIMRQIPFGFADQRNGSYGSYRSHYSTSNQLGMLERLDEDNESLDPIHLADCSDEEEGKKLSECLGQGGQIYLYWPTRLCEEFFDVDQYESSIQIRPSKDITEKESRKTLTVCKCIEKYCQMEQLEETEMWFCNLCKEHVRAWKKFHIYRAPPILIIHLKRFHYSASTHRRDKIDTVIDFPLTGLDLTSEVMHWNEEEKPIYDCYAVSNHYGGLGGGHYTAYALNDDKTWGHYDDSRVSVDVDAKEVVSSAAYVLYYRRRDIVFDTTPDFSLPAIVQDCMEYGNDVRIDCMDLDEERSPRSSSTMIYPPQKVDDDEDDGDDYYNKDDYESDHLPNAQ